VADETSTHTDVVVELFNQVCDRIEATHGPARLRTDQLFTRSDEPFMSAAWFPALVNNGFKLAVRRGGTIRILTWAHRGPFHSADVVVAPELAEEMLAALLPPAIRPAEANAVLAEQGAGRG
jgi:hypothetical protein